MPIPELERLVKIRELKSEAPSQDEMDGLIVSGAERQAHRKRNLAEYEGFLDVDPALVDALIRVTLEVAARVQELGPCRSV